MPLPFDSTLFRCVFVCLLLLCFSLFRSFISSLPLFALFHTFKSFTLGLLFFFPYQSMHRFLIISRSNRTIHSCKIFAQISSQVQSIRIVQIYAYIQYIYVYMFEYSGLCSDFEIIGQSHVWLLFHPFQ